MTAGFQWNEDNYNDPANDENQMGISQNHVLYVLSRPMVSSPGQTFNYNGGETQLLAAIVQKSTGKPVDAFAKEYLFSPLGISNFNWTTTEYLDLPEACCGLYLRSGDMLRFGLLYLQDGKWNGKQVVSARWVKESLGPYIKVDDDAAGDYGIYSYGFQWWLKTDTIVNQQVSLAICIGNGGQRIFIDKANKIVVVFTAGNYRRPDLFLVPYHILTKYIYPALLKKE
jgi:CubicO group peptidase (beta-lactamase class C family)